MSQPSLQVSPAGLPSSRIVTAARKDWLTAEPVYELLTNPYSHGLRISTTILEEPKGGRSCRGGFGVSDEALHTSGGAEHHAPACLSVVQLPACPPVYYYTCARDLTSLLACP